MKTLIVGGHGGRSGVPAYVSLLAKKVFEFDCDAVTDIDEGGYSGIKSEVKNYYEVPGLASKSRVVDKVSAFKALYDIVSKGEYDIVWANSSVSVNYARLICFLTSFKGRLVVTYHGLPYGPGRNKNIARIAFLVEWCMVRLNRNEIDVLISKKDMGLYSELGWERNKTAIINNPVSIRSDEKKKFHLSGRHRLVMTTRYSYQKNLEYAVDIIDKLPDSELHIYGKVPAHQRGMLLDRVEDQSKVKFHGEKDNVTSLLKEFDCYLMTSNYEGFPLGALEAAGIGLAIAMTDVGGREEIVDEGSYGEVLPFQDAVLSARIVHSLIARYRDNEGSISEIQGLSERFSLDSWERMNGNLFS